MHTRIVLTGGPSAGKTTLLMLLHKRYYNRVAVAPEAASIVFSGGEKRPVTLEDCVQIQRKIYNLQHDLELSALRNSVTVYDDAPRAVFCDRGSLDGSAYWPGTVKEYCFAMGTTLERELTRYSAVLHLQSAAVAGEGYVNTAIRTESPEEAAELDRRIAEVWQHHPNYMFVPNQGTFARKLEAALAQLNPYLPDETDMFATVSDLLAHAPN